MSELWSIPREVVVAYAIKFGKLIAPNLFKFNGQLYHLVPDRFGVITVTVSDVPVLSFGWD